MTPLRLAFAASALLAVTPASNAQNALGDGTGLDGNLNINGPRNLPGRDIQSEIRFRDAVVTGNAPSFLSFRGDIPYTAPDSFRGELGSNDLFAFRRDSLFSGLSGNGLRGTEAVQFQMAYTTGTQTPSGLIGSFIVPESGRGNSGANVAAGYNPLDRTSRIIHQAGPNEIGFDDRGRLLDTLRSPSAYNANRDYRPALIGVTDPENPYGGVITASGLLGIRVAVPGLADEDQPSGSDEQESRLDARLNAQRIDAGSETTLIGISQRIDDRISGRLEGTAGSEPDRSTGGLEVQALRKYIQSGFDETDDETISRDSLVPQASPDAQPVPGAPEDPRPSNAPTEPAPQPRSRQPGEFDISAALPALEQALREDPPVRRFVEGANRDVFADAIRSGERTLASGDYFDAEEHFTLAMTIRPTDPTARVGRVHAQLGAGLYLSAGVNLRGLLTDHPELAAVRYDPALLPADDRVVELTVWLADAADPETELVSTAVRREAGLLLAYLGVQIDDPELIRKGLDSFTTEAAANTEATGPAERRLADLLRRLWLGEADTSTGGTPPR